MKYLNYRKLVYMVLSIWIIEYSCELFGVFKTTKGVLLKSGNGKSEILAVITAVFSVLRYFNK